MTETAIAERAYLYCVNGHSTDQTHNWLHAEYIENLVSSGKLRTMSNPESCAQCGDDCYLQLPCWHGNQAICDFCAPVALEPVYKQVLHVASNLSSEPGRQEQEEQGQGREHKRRKKKKKFLRIFRGKK